MKVTLGLGLQDPPAWVLALADGTYVDQTGAHSHRGELRLQRRGPRRPPPPTSSQDRRPICRCPNFYAIRVASGGDGEMLYPGGGTYWAFDNRRPDRQRPAPAGMTPNPDPKWKPGTTGLTPAQIATWVNWYVGGLDNVTNWQMHDPERPGLQRLLRDRHPRFRHPPRRPDPDRATATCPTTAPPASAPSGSSTTPTLPTKTNVIAYISSVADKSGGNDNCARPPTTTQLPHHPRRMDSWSATRWISAGSPTTYGLAGRRREPRPRTSPPASTPSTPTPPPPA